MTPAQMIHLPLAGAYLCCQDGCHAVGNCAERCPACSSPNVLSLARVLNQSIRCASPDDRQIEGLGAASRG